MQKAKRWLDKWEGGWKRASANQKVVMYICIYTCLFLVAFTVAYSPFFVQKKSFICSIDARSQHFPALIYIGKYWRQYIMGLLHGKLSLPLFDLSIGMGEDVIYTLNYYGFGDPLNLLAIFVPIRYTEYLYDFLMVFRLYLAGLAFSALCTYHKNPVRYILPGAFIYIFCGYTFLYSIQWPPFINPMIQFPVLLIGSDQIIQKKKSFLFSLTIFYASVCGFYFLYMMTIMAGVYILIRHFTLNSVKYFKNFVQMSMRVIGSYLLGIGIGGILFVPAVLGYLNSSRVIYGRHDLGAERLFYSWKYACVRILQLITPRSDLFSAAIVLLALVLLLLSKRTYRSLKWLFAVSAAVYVSPLGCSVMNGFSYVSTRWTFGMALLLAYIVVAMLPTLLNQGKIQKMISSIIILLYVTAAIRNYDQSPNHYMSIIMLGITWGMIVLLNLKNVRQFIGNSCVGAGICLTIVICNVCINAVYNFYNQNIMDEFTQYGTETASLLGACERAATDYMDDGEGRLDGTYIMPGRGMIWYVPTVSSSWSIGNSYIHELLEKTENCRISTSSSIFWGIDQRTLMETLLSVKYFAGSNSEDSNCPYGFEMIEDDSGEGKFIFENQNALPWGYTYDSYVPYSKIECMNGLEREESMLQSIALQEGGEGISEGDVNSNIEEIPYTITEMQHIKWKNGTLHVEEDHAAMTLSFEIPAQREGYLRLQGFNINGSVQNMFRLLVDSGSISKTALVTSEDYNWYFGRENYLFNLGYSDEKSTKCTITFPKAGVFKLADIQMLSLPVREYTEQIEALRSEPLEDIQFETNKISGTISLSSNKILCMSIPYSKGWSVKVDGEAAEIMRGNYMFMALPLKEGSHIIEFTYCTPGLKPGLILSGLSFGIAALIYIRRYTQKRRAENG